MADVNVSGELPSLTQISVTTTAQSIALPPRARAAYVIEATTNLQYSFDGVVFADAPNAAGFLAWSRAQHHASAGAAVLHLKLASGSPSTIRLDVRDHL